MVLNASVNNLSIFLGSPESIAHRGVAADRKLIYNIQHY